MGYSAAANDYFIIIFVFVAVSIVQICCVSVKHDVSCSNSSRIESMFSGSILIVCYRTPLRPLLFSLQLTINHSWWQNDPFLVLWKVFGVRKQAGTHEVAQKERAKPNKVQLISKKYPINLRLISFSFTAAQSEEWRSISKSVSYAASIFLSHQSKTCRYRGLWWGRMRRRRGTRRFTRTRTVRVCIQPPPRQ